MIATSCSRCGRPAAAEDRFCGGCGTELTLACPACGRALASDVAFCTGCGARLGHLTPTATSEDRRRISVLFIDLIDFTPYVEQSDPELVREMQQGFFTTARRIIGQYGGVVEKYIGDAVMALFGAPVATETDAVRCVRAGLELQRALTRYAPDGAADSRTGRPGDTFVGRFRVGIATGEALVDVAAARDGGQAIVAGDVVTTASRLQSVAPPGGVVVDEATYAATKSAIRYSEQAPVTLRGRSSLTQVWLAVAPLHRTHPDREADGAPLVNRTHELGLLVNGLHRAVLDRIPQLVSVLGRAGIGKSRLVRELYQHSEQLLDASVAWRTGRCPPFGENVTYAALADIVKAEAGILDTDRADVARERLDAALRDLVGAAEMARLSDALGPLVGLRGSALTGEEAESAWRRFVVALASRRPTVLVFEDLHWADEKMLRFVELLGATVRDVPLMLLCTARPELVERNPGWAGTIAGSLTIALPPLRRPEIATMYAHLLGRAAFPPELFDPLVELADGNPLYAHEYTRMLIEQGRLRPAELLGAPDGLPMPDSVHAVIANRVDLLDAADRNVLQAAAVVGMQFWPGAVAAALGQPADVVDRTLRRLEQRDLIHEQPSSTMAGQPEYRFGHVLVRDVCYQRLPRTERMARHARTADWLDRVAGDRSTDLAEVLAHHRYTAHEIARTLGLDAQRYAPAARDALRRAARRAYALQAHETAAGHAARALALFDVASGDAAQARERLGVELLAAEISFYADRDAFLSDGGEERLRTLARSLLAGGDRAHAARAWTLLGQAAWLRADRLAALSCLRHAVDLFDGLPDTPEKADAFAELGRLHMLNHERDPAVAAAGRAADIAERLGLVEVAASARVTVGTARYKAGDRGGLAELRSVTQLCRDRHLLALRRAIQNLSFALREEGDIAGSLELLEEVRLGMPGGHNLATGYSYEAMCAHVDGEWEKMLAAESDLATSGGEWDLQVRGLCAEVRLMRDDDAGCADPDEIEELLAAGRRSGFYRLEWTALAHVALCRVLQGRADEATALLSELVDSWRTVRALASGEWIDAASHAAAISGRAACARLRELLDEVPHRTLWVDAATRTVTGGLAAADGDHARAAELHLAAADLYAEMRHATNRALSLAAAARSLGRLGSDDRSAPVCREVEAFADRNQAPGLLRLAGMAAP
ncbi:AAA family ATPase [Planosporangium thailandense]|uniref:AAA family ATPase n=1 Tax=Planosporangium thailandense TaxID=765197 RepID=A0ABX0XUK9_9ACTN|nr:AAA family ATPase [Planosporangium thailandense]